MMQAAAGGVATVAHVDAWAHTTLDMAKNAHAMDVLGVGMCVPDSQWMHAADD